MSFDGLVVRAAVHELQKCVGGRLHKIHQPNEYELVFSIRARSGSAKLLLSANPSYPRFHLTDRSYQNPLEAPMFCMLLRKYCENGIIESIEQVGMERIVYLHIRKSDDIGDTSVKRIIVEMTGRHSNIILTDAAANTVLDAIRRVTPAISSHRIIVPGSAYVPPPEQEKRSPLDATAGEVEELLQTSGVAKEEFAKLLVEHYSGLGPLAARLMTAHSGAHETAEAFVQSMEDIRNHRYAPNIGVDKRSGKLLFSVLRLDGIAEVQSVFGSISDCLEAYYGNKAERDAVRQKASDLIRLLQNEKQKNEKKLEKLRETLDEAKEADRFRKFGELLHAHMHRLEKGADKAEVEDYYDEAQAIATIPLDPLLTPSENAQRYFKKYQKLKNSLSAVKEQMEIAEAEMVYFDTLLQQLDGAALTDIEEIRAELIAGGYIRDRGTKPARKPRRNELPSVQIFESSEGIAIYVGKNNTQNDYITNRLAHPSDTWLHTKDMPGSHVVIRSNAFGEATLMEAANLAAYFSKGKQSSSVPVDYTLVKHVKKPSGAKPGFVIYDKQKTLFITPDEEAVRKMRVTKSKS